MIATAGTTVVLAAAIAAATPAKYSIRDGHWRVAHTAHHSRRLFKGTYGTRNHDGVVSVYPYLPTYLHVSSTRILPSCNSRTQH